MSLLRREKKRYLRNLDGFPLLYFVFTSVLSLARFEKDAAPKEDEVNPALHMQFLRDKLTSHAVQS